MYPELFRIGDFPITTYGIWLALGMLAGLFVASRLAMRDGISSNQMYDIGLWSIIGGLVGSKLLMYLVEPDVKVFTLDFLRSGGVFYGGLIGGFFALVAVVLYHKLSFWKVADASAPAMALAQAFGRQGCFAAGCCWGKQTTSAIGVHFTDLGHEYTGVPVYGPDQSSIFLYPTQMIESLTMLIVFAFLFWLHRHRKFSGQVLIAYGIIYSIFRFSIEFIRDDPRGDLFGLTSLTGLSTSQMVSLAVFVTAIVFLIWRLRSSDIRRSQPG